MPTGPSRMQPMPSTTPSTLSMTRNWHCSTRSTRVLTQTNGPRSPARRSARLPRASLKARRDCSPASWQPDNGHARIQDLRELAERADLRQPSAMSAYFNDPPVIRPVGYSHRTRAEMIFLIATGDYSYRQIGARYGRNENAVSQFAFDNKDAIHKERARLHQQLELHFDGRLRYGTRILEQIIAAVDARIQDLRELVERADLRYMSGQAAWLNYHAAWCRYRELQTDGVRLLVEEVDPRRRRVREEAAVDVDDIFEPVCPRCLA